MSTSPPDRLYLIFETLLHSGDYDEVPTDIFLGDVVERYWIEMDLGKSVPLRQRESVRNDLIDDVRDMLRIKIYVSSGVAEYNRRRAK